MTFLGFGASWWVATPVMLPAVFIVGLLIIRKIRKFSLFFTFSIVVVIEMIFFGFTYNLLPQKVLTQLLLSWPFMFFASIMLTEPLTMPPTRKLQMLYGALVGFLFAFQLPLGPIFFTPELALVAGNIFSYFVGSKQRVILVLQGVDKLSSTIYNYRFRPSEKLKFKAGQYAEWTLPHKNPDARGNRRFFTIASSPTEDEIMLGVRISDDGSSFKRALLNLKVHDKISLGSLAGDFTLPEESNKKLVFLAGGIGITPFRSILKYLIDKNEVHDIVFFHSCSNGDDFVYDDIIHDAEEKIGLQMHCLLSERDDAPKEFKGEFGHLTFEMLKQAVPDYKERVFYISGSNAMVDMSKETLRNAGVKNSEIVTDYFSGY
jgi:ferredoxin-NADP reductase